MIIQLLSLKCMKHHRFEKLHFCSIVGIIGLFHTKIGLSRDIFKKVGISRKNRADLKAWTH